MDRKEICEAIVLTAAEKKLLKEIRTGNVNGQK